MKKRTGNKRVLRAIALGLATVVTLTSVPVTTLAEDQTGVIIVEDLRVDLSSGNLTDQTKAVVAEAKEADSKSDAAAAVANQAAGFAADAADSAKVAAAEAQNAKDIAAEAAKMYDIVNGTATGTLADGTTLVNNINAAANVTEDNDDTVENAVEAYNAALNAITGENAANAKITAVNDKMEEADQAISSANTAVTGLTGENGKVAAANVAIGQANDAKGTKNETDPTQSTGTEALIQAAEAELTGLEQRENTLKTDIGSDEKGKESGLKKDIQEVKARVTAVEQKYADADDTTKKTLDGITSSLTESFKNVKTDGQGAAGDAETAKNNAETERGKAETALSYTWANYYAIKNMVDNYSDDVDTANQYAANARVYANQAAQAASNAAAYAAAAAVAEGVAQTNYTKAGEAYKKALDDLDAAIAEYNRLYGEANDNADTVDGRVESVNGNINAINGRINTLNGDVADFNDDKNANSKRNIANASIESTNQKIAEAQALIDEILNGTNGQDSLVAQANALIEAANTLIGQLNGDGTDADPGLISTANSAIETAQNLITAAGTAKTTQLQNIESALTALGTAKENYDKAVAQKKYAQESNHTAQEWAELAADAADDAMENADKILDAAVEGNIVQAALNAFNGQTGAVKDNKDALASVTNKGKTYQQLVTEKTTAKSDYDTKWDGENRTVAEIEADNKYIEEKGYGITGWFFDYTDVIKDPYKKIPDWVWIIGGTRLFSDADIDEANRHVTNAGKLNSKKELDTTTENLAKVDDYVYTPANIAVVNESDLQHLERLVAHLDSIGDVTTKQKYIDLMSGLRVHYGPGDGGNGDRSYKTVDHETTEYAPCVGADLPWKATRERELENKYGEWYQFLWISDDKIFSNMKSIANEKCVLVCEDVEKIALFRSTLAEAKYEAAKETATAARNIAQTAKNDVVKADGTLQDAIKKEQTALNRYAQLKALLVQYDQKGNLTGGAKKTIGDIDVNGLSGKFSTLNYNANSPYAAIDELNADDIESLLTELTSGYGDTRVGKYQYTNIATLGSVDKTTRRKAQDLKGTTLAETDDKKKSELQKAIELLKKALEDAAEDLKAAGESLEKAQEEREAADKKYEKAKKDAEEADRVANAAAELAKQTDRSSGGSESGTYVVEETVIPVIPLTTTPSGVAGVRTGRRTAGRAVSDNSGVLGVKTEATDTTKKEVAQVEKKDEKKKDTDKKFTKVETPTTPLAAAPLEEGMNLNFLWLIVAAAIITGVVTYGNHRKKVAANEEAKKYKK